MRVQVCTKPPVTSNLCAGVCWLWSKKLLFSRYPAFQDVFSALIKGEKASSLFQLEEGVVGEGGGTEREKRLTPPPPSSSRDTAILRTIPSHAPTSLFTDLFYFPPFSVFCIMIPFAVEEKRNSQAYSAGISVLRVDPVLAYARMMFRHAALLLLYAHKDRATVVSDE